MLYIPSSRYSYHYIVLLGVVVYFVCLVCVCVCCRLCGVCVGGVECYSHQCGPAISHLVQYVFFYHQELFKNVRLRWLQEEYKSS